MADIRLRDLDNRGDDGEPYEFFGTVDQVVAYLDGPLRDDLTDPDTYAEIIDEAIADIRAGRVRRASGRLSAMSVYLDHQSTEEGDAL